MSQKDRAALAALTELLKSAPVERDLIDAVLCAGRQLPSAWKEAPLPELVWRLRLRQGMTQRQLAALSGLTPACVAGIELGRDIRLSTLRQVFAGLGCGLALVPLTRLKRRGFELRLDELCREGRLARRRRYPRWTEGLGPGGLRREERRPRET